MTRWQEALELSQFDGSQTEMNRFIEQRWAGMARKAFAALGRGVVIVRLDHTDQTMRGEYDTMETDDGSASSQHIRGLVKTYDPEQQAVILYRDPESGRDVAAIVDIDTVH